MPFFKILPKYIFYLFSGGIDWTPNVERFDRIKESNIINSAKKSPKSVRGNDVTVAVAIADVRVKRDWSVKVKKRKKEEEGD